MNRLKERHAKRHDPLFLGLFALMLILSVILGIVNLPLVVLGALACAMVVYLWWIETRKLPYTLRCPNCNQITEGTLATYLSHPHDFEKVHMRCPHCGQDVWLEATNA